MTAALDLPEAIALANEHFRAGRLVEADAVVAAICAALPTQAARDDLRLKIFMQRRDWVLAFDLGEQMIHAAEGAVPRPLMGLGNHLVECGEFLRAERAFRLTLDHHPDFPEAHFNRAHALLALGRYEEAWPEFEWRYRLEQASGYVATDVAQMWDGRDLDGGTLLVQTEQGYGDAIQFLRLLPFAARRCGRLVVMCRAPLARLIQLMPLNRPIEVIESVPTERQGLKVDAYCPIGRLAGLASTTARSVPDEVPYLLAPRDARQHWRQMLDRSAEAGEAAPAASPGGSALPAARPRRKVGLVWAGNPANGADHKRSMAAANLNPLLALGHLDFISVQVGAAAPQLSDSRVLAVGHHLRDFADTAALLHELDLLVTVETSVSHLAAALGLPALVLLAHVPDWRYVDEEAARRWFPTLEFFRQPRAGDWAAVVDAVRGRLLQIFPGPSGAQPGAQRSSDRGC